MKYDKALPDAPIGWSTSLRAKWYEEDVVVASIERIRDADGGITPFDYQQDNRTPPQFVSGYAILGTNLVFASWGGLRDYWNGKRDADKAKDARATG